MPLAVPAVFTVAHIRLRGQEADIAVYRGPGNSLCLQLPTSDTVPCDLAPRPGRAIRLAYANWVYLDATGYGFGMLLVGTVSPAVAPVRISLGNDKWIKARVVSLPEELNIAFRLFYIERRISFESLNQSLPVVALDNQGREIGRTSYRIEGG